ncbi:LysR family transcriptional regulator [Myceligenerans pegani]|uniref:LysR family transcriptional regulator n=1 Tax=Myceligenerans pegani TaxID=2776917 RepID=A0ABR9N572_9MICO|nr:LysR family transcriptional regulator [Myceligenerans sp. TRM 65318]MBE1878331.1 LysR family transcriptional regulator [Myceligenerans sp. TRM 65318]MBE3020602.1 LysR family transcriptional regulator [Myceligenerans sp. TRM 65318]
MSDLETRELRYFIAVAEELSFRRAAARVGIAQPPLSRAIRALEHRLGVQLLVRTTRTVRLTSAGEALLDDARAALDLIDAAARRARHAGATRPTLRVALKADFDGGLLTPILEAYRRQEDHLPADLVLGSRGQQAPALREGRADVALLPSPYDLDGLDHEPLASEPRLVALPASDPLAARASLCLTDLEGRSLPDGSPAADGGLPRTPEDAPHLDLSQVFNLIQFGEVVLFVPVSLAQRHQRPDIAYRPVDDLSPFELAVAWPQTSRSRAVAAFVRAATEVAAGHSPQGAEPAAVPAEAG